MSVVPLTVTITAQDIARGVQSDAERCPLARALKRRLKTTYRPDVGISEVDLYRTSTGRLAHKRPLPAVAMNWVTAFDDGEPVEPLTFRLTVPAQVVRDAK